MNKKDAYTVFNYLSNSMIQFLKERKVNPNSINSLINAHRTILHNLNPSVNTEPVSPLRSLQPTTIKFFKQESKLDDYIKKKERMLYTITTSKYISFLQDEIKYMKRNLTFNKYNDTILYKYLSPYEQRLLMFHTFYNTSISQTDVDQCKKMIQFDCKKIFKKEVLRVSILQQFMNYSLALIGIKEWLDIHIKHIKNVVYCPILKDYYIITGKNSNRFEWRKDENLTSFSDNFQSFLVDKIVFLYRKIYKSVFKDNDFRSDMNDYGDIVQFECSLLVMNLIFVSSWDHFHSYICKTITKHHTKRLTRQKTNQTTIEANHHYQNNRPVPNIKRLFNIIATNDLHSTFLPKIENYLRIKV